MTKKFQKKIIIYYHLSGGKVFTKKSHYSDDIHRPQRPI